MANKSSRKRKSLLTPLDQVFVEFLRNASYRDPDLALKDFAKLDAEALNTLRQEAQARTQVNALRAHALGVKLD